MRYFLLLTCVLSSQGYVVLDSEYLSVLIREYITRRCFHISVREETFFLFCPSSKLLIMHLWFSPSHLLTFHKHQTLFSIFYTQSHFLLSYSPELPQPLEVIAQSQSREIKMEKPRCSRYNIMLLMSLNVDFLRKVGLMGRLEHVVLQSPQQLKVSTATSHHWMKRLVNWSTSSRGILHCSGIF